MTELEGKSQYRYVLGRQDDVKVVKMSTGDHKILKYMASKDKKTMAEELHDLFLLGVKCKSEQHVARMRRVGLNI